MKTGTFPLFSTGVAMIRNAVKRIILSGAFAGCIALILSCASKTTTITTTRTPQSGKTNECALQDELCTEAREFQKIYDTLPQEQQKDMVAALNTYVEQCEDAKKKCEKSMK
jgi:esterase/lipase